MSSCCIGWICSGAAFTNFLSSHCISAVLRPGRSPMENLFRSKYLTSGNSRKHRNIPPEIQNIDLDRKKSEPSANPTSAFLYLRRRRRDSVFSNPTTRPSARNARSSPVLREKKGKKFASLLVELLDLTGSFFILTASLKLAE